MAALDLGSVPIAEVESPSLRLAFFLGAIATGLEFERPRRRFVNILRNQSSGRRVRNVDVEALELG
jgi:hypothetical protein